MPSSTTTSTVAAAIRSRLLATPSWVLLIEIFIGAGWLRASTEKIISADWWRGDTLTAFLVDTEPGRVPWFQLVIDTVVAPNVVVIGIVVIGLQALVGTALVTGRMRGPALLAGVTMNTAFVLTGAVTPSAFYLLAQLAVLLWLIESAPNRRADALASSLTLGGLALAGSAVLSIRTLHPEHVIDDASMMLVFLGVLTAVGAERARHGRVAPVGAEPIDAEAVRV